MPDPLPPDLAALQKEVVQYARDFGLDFFETIFEVIDYDEMNMVAARTGFPIRYPYWRFGMEYEALSRSYEYGLSKIYEMVINTDPSYAYLMRGNEYVTQKLVMAHVYGHVDFFKNNMYFGHTNRKMVDQMANHATRIRRYIDRHGLERVESWLDACLSIENLIDYHAPAIKRRRPRGDGERDPETPGKLPAKEYMDEYINPKEFLDRQRAKLDQEAERERKIPPEPEKDILSFLIDYAPLEPWERDVLSIVRKEAYYFAPQAMTKVMNEGWACVAPASLVFSDLGLITMAELHGEESVRVSDGDAGQRVYDRHVIHDHPMVTIRTRRGLELEGSNNHRILVNDEDWKRLDELEVGDTVHVAGGAGLWPTDEVKLSWQPRVRASLVDVAEEAGVSVDTVIRHRAGRRVRRQGAVAFALEQYDQPENKAARIKSVKAIRVPGTVSKELATFLGYLVGDGHISRKKRQLGLTSGDRQPIEEFVRLGAELFGLNAVVRKDGTRWRALYYSEALSDLCEHGLGLTTGPSAADKVVPKAVLRSPQPVVAAFLRAYFDADGYAGKQGVILSTKSEEMSKQVQLLLLNFGILSRRRAQKDGCWHVHVAGRSAQKFADEIGFALPRKKGALDEYLQSHQWFKEESWDDEIVSIEHGRGDVYDISVENTHRYAAQGFINHNSYWHSRIMTEKALKPNEFIDYADQNAGVLATSPGRLNPYKLGVELWRNIAERWDKGKFGREYNDCDDMDALKRWDKKLGLGQEKIFEVRRLYCDLTFIDEFLTEEFCREQKLFVYDYNKNSGYYEIRDRAFRKIKQRLLFQLTNFGHPFIFVADANFENRAELLLLHKHEGVDLDYDYARDTLANIQKIWRRPVNIETVIDGKKALLTFDGKEHVERELDQLTLL